MYVYVGERKRERENRPAELRETSDPHRARVTGRCELPGTGTRNPTRVIRKSNMNS